MTHVEEVAPRTYRIQARVPGLNTIFSIYIIKEGDGVLIEPGPAAVIPAVEEAMQKLGLGALKYIIPTHIHLDHGGACGRLVQLFPGATVIVHPEGARHIIAPSRLIRSTRMAFGDDFEAVYGVILPVPESRVRTVKDGERLTFDGRELIFIHTPGHAPHHIAIFDSTIQGLFCGEALGLVYNAGSEALPAVAPPGFDIEEYLGAMERLRELKPRLLFYAHGSVSRDAEKSISSVMENTRIVGDVILAALKNGETEEAIIRHTGEFILNRYGARLEEYDLASNVLGYIHYYRRRGLA